MATEKKEAKKPAFIRTVYGRMVDPHTGLVYDVTPCELLKLTGWVQSQLDAKKMALV